MKNITNLLFALCLFSLSIASCGDDEEPENNCITDPNVTVEANIVGTWVIDSEATETVTFNADGTGSSSEAAFHFSTTNAGKDYHNFTWEMEDATTVVVTYDYSPDVPEIPFIISEDYIVITNQCDNLEVEPPFSTSNLILTR